MTNKEAPYKVESNTSCKICRATAFRPDEECAKCPVEHEPANPVIVQLKKELAEARDNELTAQGLKLKGSVFWWRGQQCGLRPGSRAMRHKRIKEIKKE